MFPVLSANTLSTGYNINNSLRFRASASPYLSRTPSSSGNRQTWTWSGWVKRGSLGSFQVLFGAGQNNPATSDDLVSLYINSSDQIAHYVVQNAVADCNNVSTMVLRDPSAWYHIVFIYDSTNATASNRQRIYVNGTQVTSFSSTTYVSQNYQAGVNLASRPHALGVYAYNFSSRYFDGYMSEVNFIDGQALTPSSFGETDTTTGAWKPKAYTGTYGTNGFYLKFSDIATTSGSNAGLGKDFSGNSNYYNTTNISVTAGTTYDAMIDSPTNTSATVANYATLNPLQSSVALTAGNLDFSSGGGESCPKATIQLPLTGKWYWETYCSATGTDNWIGVTIDQTGTTFTSGGIYRAYRKTGIKESNGTSSSYGASWAAGDTLGVAVDMDAGTIVFYKNGTSQGTAYSDLAGIQWTVFFYGYISAGHQVNFGQRPFAYTPPTGFVRLNTFNLPTSTIKKGNTVMDATLYTGNLTGQSITNAAAFKPDLVWIKSRSAATDNKLTDSVRGATKALVSNSTAAETTDLTGMTAFNSNGFTLGASTTYNNTGVTYVGWQWQAGQSSGVSNTDGSITTTISASATAGFSVIKFTGTQANATIGHGLGVAPKMVIVKTYGGGTRGWRVYHASVGNTKYLILNDTSAETTDSTAWNNTTPTSTVISLGANGETNNGGSLMIAYAWAEIAGFSKFGSYTGNGSTDGPFVYTGFRPSFVMIKKSSSTGSWAILDTARNPYNVANTSLYPDLSNAENSSFEARDYLSNGFKLRTTDQNSNASGATFIYMAFAENPFKNANAR